MNNLSTSVVTRTLPFILIIIKGNGILFAFVVIVVVAVVFILFLHGILVSVVPAS